MKHHCHAHGCTRAIPPKLFMCPPHWKALPTELKAAIWREYRPGQEKDKRASYRYLAVQQRAVAFSASQLGDHEAATKYIHSSEAFRQRAVEAGQGDPLEVVDRIIAARFRDK